MGRWCAAHSHHIVSRLFWRWKSPGCWKPAPTRCTGCMFPDRSRVHWHGPHKPDRFLIFLRQQLFLYRMLHPWRKDRDHSEGQRLSEIGCARSVFPNQIRRSLQKYHQNLKKYLRIRQSLKTRTLPNPGDRIDHRFSVFGRPWVRHRLLRIPWSFLRPLCSPDSYPDGILWPAFDRLSWFPLLKRFGRRLKFRNNLSCSACITCIVNGIWPYYLVLKIMQHGVLSMHDG